MDEVFSDPAFAALKARGAAFAILRPGDGAVAWANAAAAAFWAAADADALASVLLGPAGQGGGWLDGLSQGIVPGRPPRLVRGGLGRGFRMRAHTAVLVALASPDGEVLLGVAAPESIDLAAEPDAWRRPAWPQAAPDTPEQPEGAPPEAAAQDEAAPEPEAGPSLARRSQIAVLRDRLDQALDGAATLRLVWRTDADATVTQIDAASFARLAAPLRFADGPLPDLLAPYDPAGAERLRAAFASHATWSGLAVALPVADGAARVPLTLSATPVFQADRGFAGFRGFGTLDLGRLDLAPPSAPRAAPAPPEPPADPEPAAAAAPPAAVAVPPAAVAPPTEAVQEAAPPAPARPAADLPAPSANVVHLRAFQAMMSGRSAAAAEPVAPPPSDGPAEPRDDAPAAAVEEAEAATDAASDEASSADAPSGDVPSGDVPSSDDLAFLALGEALRARIGAPPSPGDAEAAAAPPATRPAVVAAPGVETRLLDQLPVGLVVVAAHMPVFANAAAAAQLGVESPGDVLTAGEDLLTGIEARPTEILWDGAPAALLILDPPERPAAVAPPERPAEDTRAGELLDRIDDAVALLDGNGLVRRLNRRGEAWFGAEDALGRSFTEILAPESRPAALALLGEVRNQRDGLGLPPPRREVLARTGEAPAAPMVLTLGRLGDAGFYLILRDVTALKRAESERDRTEREQARDADRLPQLLGKVSHEIRTPLNAILGFAEVMMDERFGPLGNPRYRDYLKDIHASGTQVMALVEDLLDLSRIEAGQLDLDVAAVEVNRIVAETVAQMQPEAHRERVIMRTSLGGRIPPVLADESSTRQIVRNLLSNAVKFNEPGGQVIVSTAVGENGAVLLRVRDTGVGMTDDEIAAALEPFGGASASGRGNGLGLPVTRALVGANGASMAIRSRPREGTLVEVAFASAGPADARRPA